MNIIRIIMIRIRSFSLRFFIVFLSIIIGVGLIEITLRILQPEDSWTKLRYGNIRRNIEHTYHIDGLYETSDGSVDYVRDDYGLRDNCGNPGDIDILTVGGSTTAQRFVHFPDTYQFILGSLISDFVGDEVCVSNSGIVGHSTYGHLFSFTDWFPLIPDLSPSYVLLYVGINDAPYGRISVSNKFDKRPIDQLEDILKRLRVVQNLRPLYHYYRNGFSNRAAYAANGSIIYESSDYTISTLHADSFDLSLANASAFRVRLSMLLNQISLMGSSPICVTQPHHYVRDMDGERMGIPSVFSRDNDGSNYREFSGLDYDYSLRALNDVMRDLCGSNLIDLYPEDFSQKHFYDGVHTTGVGSRLIGDLIFEKMRDQGFLGIFQ